MASYSYTAIDKSGKTETGIIDADSSKLVRIKLREQGLIPVEVEESTKKMQAKTESASIFAPSINASSLALITRQLATLVAAAIPIEEALKAVADQCENAQHRTIISAVRNKVLEGHTLADSMAQFPRVFDNLYRAMVSAGEKSGHLDTVLLRLADYSEKRQAIKGKVMQAMIYPVILTIVAISVITILLTSVVPKVIAQFVYLKKGLPGSTQMLITISDFLRAYGLYIAVMLAGGFVLFKMWQRKKENRVKFHHLILRLPVIGRVSRGINTARFARTLAILNSSAVPLLEALKISGEVLGNDYAQEKIREATDLVREGSSLKIALERTGLFPPMMIHMIASGEKSGELDGMLIRSADNQDNEFERQVSMALSIFEPMLIVTMAGVVLFIVLAILEPILKMNSMA
ncbi:MAG: type II secretion system inner membrane protein GspF [Succinivibrionaceae bacterium]|nr:type II secretion system inner membrane protein GspF [Succinivibrionaceae bacterium]